MPLDEDGVPTLTADLTETQSIRDTLHNVDRVLVDNRDVMKDALLGFETYTASLAGKGDEIDSMLRKADTAFDSFDSGIAKIDGIVPGLANGKDGELFQKLKSIRELAESFNKRSAVFMEKAAAPCLISARCQPVDRKFGRTRQAACGGAAGASGAVGLGSIPPPTISPRDSAGPRH